MVPSAPRRRLPRAASNFGAGAADGVFASLINEKGRERGWGWKMSATRGAGVGGFTIRADTVRLLQIRRFSCLRSRAKKRNL